MASFFVLEKICMLWKLENSEVELVWEREMELCAGMRLGQIGKSRILVKPRIIC